MKTIDRRNIPEPPAPALSWEDLLAQVTGLREFERSAAHAGEKSLKWWLTWLTTFALFNDLFRVGDCWPTIQAAHEARAAALDHLKQVFSRAMPKPVAAPQRLAKRKGPR
jgi:hypothetical protein